MNLINYVEQAILWVSESVNQLAQSMSQTSIAIQIAVILLVFVLAKLLLQPKLSRVLKKISSNPLTPAALRRLVTAVDTVAGDLAWLTLQWVAIAVAISYDHPVRVMKLVASLLSAWLLIRLVSLLVKNRSLALTLSVIAWLIAALNIFGLLDDAIKLLDAWSFSMGGVRLSPLLVIKVVMSLWIFIWMAGLVSGVIERIMMRSETISPSMRVLTVKLITFFLYTMAFLVATSAAGIDLTALAVFTGALGVGLGFGLQKIFSNLVSGILLLMDKAIKPGDVISVGDNSFGWVNYLGARYASVITRDGIEHLIPNEELITQRVENWSFSDDKVRLKIKIGISYDSDVRKAVALCLESASVVPRVLKSPEARCLVTAFGDSSVDLQLRIWIRDPQNGRGNVISEVLLEVWDRFHDNGIKIPYPQRDLHIESILGKADMGGLMQSINKVA